MKNTITQNFKIRTDDDFLEELSPTPKGLEDKLPKLYQMALKGKSSAVDLILKEIKRYPKFPDLKTVLALLYDEMGRDDESDEIQFNLAKEHPDYFAGRLNTAFIHFEREEYHLMEVALSKGFDLKTMYPDRDEFHIHEVVLMQKAAVFYYCAVEDFDQAEIRLEIMEQLAPDSEDFEVANEHFRIYALRNLIGEDLDTEIEITNSNESIPDTKIPRPSFNFPVIHELFEHGYEIPQALIDEIMDLPKTEVIQDLEKVLQFSFEHFEDLVYEEVNEEETFYVGHAVYLLADLKSYDSLPVVIELLKQGEEYNEFYFGDFITEIIWDPLMRLSVNELPQLMEYMKLPDVYTYSKAIIPEMLEQMIYHYPEKREEVLTFFEEILMFYINTDNKSCIDEDLNGLIVWALTSIRDDRFNPLITQLYEKQMIDEDIAGSLESVLKTFNDPWQSYFKKDQLSMKERYQEVYEKTVNFDGEKFDEFMKQMVQSPPYPEQKQSINTNAKIQRNDPCPCGSGKKYKKCCLNK